MGLDMFLIKRKKSSKKNDLWDFKDELVYWRKANQIHKYFCNKGEEIDEEISYKLKKEDLQELIDICNKILKEVKTGPGKIKNGIHYNSKTNEWEPIWENGTTILNKEICEELLPTQSGFFFGSTEYDEYYLDNIRKTKEELGKIIDTIDYENEDVYYLASW